VKPRTGAAVSFAGTAGPALLALLSLGLLGFQSPVAAPRRIAIPLACSRGPTGQEHSVVVTVPASVSRGSRYKVHVDGVDSGKISHVGLKYIFDIGSEWPIPQGTTYVEGSAHLVPGTGTDNARPGAHVVHSAGSVTLVLPAHIDSGTSYTAPSFEFELDVTGAEGVTITQRFASYQVTAHAFLLGDVHTSCEPTPKPFPVAITTVDSGP
jgi:hypothetical protein